MFLYLNMGSVTSLWLFWDAFSSYKSINVWEVRTFSGVCLSGLDCWQADSASKLFSCKRMLLVSCCLAEICKIFSGWDQYVAPKPLKTYLSRCVSCPHQRYQCNPVPLEMQTFELSSDKLDGLSPLWSAVDGIRSLTFVLVREQNSFSFCLRTF